MINLAKSSLIEKCEPISLKMKQPMKNQPSKNIKRMVLNLKIVRQIIIKKVVELLHLLVVIKKVEEVVLIIVAMRVLLLEGVVIPKEVVEEAVEEGNKQEQDNNLMIIVEITLQKTYLKVQSKSVELMNQKKKKSKMR